MSSLPVKLVSGSYLPLFVTPTKFSVYRGKTVVSRGDEANRAVVPFITPKIDFSRGDECKKTTIFDGVTNDKI